MRVLLVLLVEVLFAACIAVGVGLVVAAASPLAGVGAGLLVAGLLGVLACERVLPQLVVRVRS